MQMDPFDSLRHIRCNSRVHARMHLRQARIPLMFFLLYISVHLRCAAGPDLRQPKHRGFLQRQLPPRGNFSFFFLFVDEAKEMLQNLFNRVQGYYKIEKLK